MAGDNELQSVGGGNLLDLERAELAHEIRTPLAAIVALSEVMRDERLGPLDERYRNYAGDINETARHGLEVVEAVLAGSYAEDRSRQGARHWPGEPVITNIETGALVLGIVSALGPMAANAGIALSTELPAGLPMLIADRRAVRQILLNLIHNGLRFTPPGGAIVVGATAGGPDAGLMLTVRDTGDGMGQEVLDRLWRTLTGGTKWHSFSGNGMGVALAAELAAANGGRLAIESVLGSGTTVKVIFAPERIVPV
ncbi:MAG: hypothetical protein RLZ98_231 [Pseudomonadota bacterium]